MLPVLVPYVGDTVPRDGKGMESYGGAYLYRVVDDDDGYWRELRDLWATGTGLIIVEQDNQVAEATLSEFDRCPRRWCTAPYPYRFPPDGEWKQEDIILIRGMGLVKFSAELTQERPDLIADIGSIYWTHLDAAVYYALYDAGERICWHRPVGHRSTWMEDWKDEFFAVMAQQDRSDQEHERKRDGRTEPEATEQAAGVEVRAAG